MESMENMDKDISNIRKHFEYPNGCLDPFNIKENIEQEEYHASVREKYLPGEIIDAYKASNKDGFNENIESNEIKYSQSNNYNINQFNEIKISTGQFNNFQIPQNKKEKEEFNFDSISNIQQNKSKNIFKDNKPIAEFTNKKSTKDNTGITEKTALTNPNLKDATKNSEIKFVVFKQNINIDKEDKELLSETDNESDDETEVDLDLENIVMTEGNKNEEDKKKDNSRKEALKAPISGIKQIIEKAMGDKLEDINLNDLFGGIEQNKKILRWKMYQIFSYSKINRKKLRDCEPSNEADKKIFYFILTRRYKFIFKNYYLNDKNFVIDGKNEIVENFPILDGIIEERRNKFYKGDNKEQKVNNFKEASKSVFLNFKDVKGRGTKCKKLKKVTLKKFEEYIEKSE